ncbi:MAG TPA: class I SAM-dependent methyltransferase [Streptosporangiaceae bacterium]|nr:class I SAM-dependent methyltransferase [Streptosporangiaceae bacterium]
MWHGEFRDPELVAYYDIAYPWSRADDFFLAVAGENGPARVLDLGCGTGRLALGMTAAGHTVTGIEPAPQSLAAARAKPGAQRVRWIQGGPAAIPQASFDVAVMTSHVAQFLVSDSDWAAALAGLHAGLVPGGRLAFDSRDPRARGWQRWNPAISRRRTVLPDGRAVEAWTEVTDLAAGAAGDSTAAGAVVGFAIHYAFPGAGNLVSTATLRFRTEAELRSSLARAGFEVEQVYGGWHREPAGAGDGEFLVIARAR